MTPTLESTRTAAWALAALVASACAHPHPSPRSTTMTDQNKRDVTNLFETCFNLGDLGLLDRLVSPDYVGVQGAKGPAGFRGVGERAAEPGHDAPEAGGSLRAL